MDRMSATLRRSAVRSAFSPTRPGVAERGTAALLAFPALGISAVVEAHSGSAHVHGELLAVPTVAAILALGTLVFRLARRRAAVRRHRLGD